MWTADNWKDYEVIDTCGGEKLERWGQYILVGYTIIFILIKEEKK